MQNKKNPFNPDPVLTCRLIVITTTSVILAIVLGIAYKAQLQLVAYHLIAPIDSKPELSISELMKNPENLRKQQDKLCAWYQREEIRDPSIVNESAIKSLCKNDR
ncbi:MAG: hypothetical protein WC856_13730 [Methylococcaceae bacterium]|jgi:hypothetical protein